MSGTKRAKREQKRSAIKRSVEKRLAEKPSASRRRNELLERAAEAKKKEIELKGGRMQAETAHVERLRTTAGGKRAPSHGSKK